jgi:biotin transporter BioY
MIGTIVIAVIGAIVIGTSIKDRQNPNREMIPFLVSLIFLLQDFAKNVM